MPTKTNEYARPAAPPDTASLTEVRDASRKCTACHLYKRATQTVGEGPKGAPWRGAFLGPSGVVPIARARHCGKETGKPSSETDLESIALESHQTMTTHPSYPAGSAGITACAAWKSFVNLGMISRRWSPRKAQPPRK